MHRVFISALATRANPLLLIHTPQGTTHIVLDEVHERSIEIDLLLLLLRDLLARRRAKAADQGAHQQQQQQQPPQLKIVLMSATADADLFCRYMGQGLAGAAPLQQGAGTGARGGRREGAGADSVGGSVGSITIPGFTYPVREFYLEDAFELTGHVIGRDNKYARRGGPRRGGKGQQQGGEGEEGGGGDLVLSGSLPSYSEATLRSLAVVDEDQVGRGAGCGVSCKAVGAVGTALAEWTADGGGLRWRGAV